MSIGKLFTAPILAPAAAPSQPESSPPSTATKYDPMDFLVAPADAKGTSYRMTFRAPPDFEKAIDKILAGKQFPFGSRGDVLRWAVLQGIKQLEKMEGMESTTGRVDALTLILNEEQTHSEFLDIFNLLEDGVAKYLADQAPDQASRIVALAKHKFEQMPEGHWRDRYLEELSKRFSHLLKKPGISLVSIL